MGLEGCLGSFKEDRKRSYSFSKKITSNVFDTDQLDFVGYHGTNEASAKKIISNGLDGDVLPVGQIGQGLYVGKSRAISEWATSQATRLALNRCERNTSTFNKVRNGFLSYFGGGLDYFKYSPRLEDEAKPAVLKVYSKRPLKEAQWNSMMSYEIFDGLKFIESRQKRISEAEESEIVKKRKWLQMVIPVHELKYLVVKRDDGVDESPRWPSRESSISSIKYSDIPIGRAHPEFPYDSRMEDFESNRRKAWKRSKTK